jgi:hypothetical protein
MRAFVATREVERSLVRSFSLGLAFFYFFVFPSTGVRNDPASLYILCDIVISNITCRVSRFFISTTVLARFFLRSTLKIPVISVSKHITRGRAVVGQVQNTWSDQRIHA